jgi:TPR repeat protein
MTRPMRPEWSGLREALAATPLDTVRLVATADAVLSLVERGDCAVGILPVSSIDDVRAGYLQAAALGSAAAVAGLRRMPWVLIGQDLTGGPIFASIVEALAGLGDREASLLAARLWMDLGDEAHAAQAVALARRAAEADDDGAAHLILGYMAHRGYGLPPDDLESARLHAIAAARGNAEAQFELAVFAHTGLVGPPDQEAAVRWCREAAERGHARALYSLGAFYATGDGVAQDAAAALACYLRAADAGHGKAAATAGVMCWRGEGTPVDRPRARGLFRRAEAQGVDLDPLLEEAGIVVEDR